MRCMAAIDVGGGSAKIGIVDSHGAILGRDLIPTPTACGAEELAETYARSIESLLKRLKGCSPIGVGVGLPGYLDEDRRTSRFSNVPLLDGFPLATFLEHRLRLPARADNDATLAALAEHRFGAGGKARRLLVATLGTGIGVGLVRNGEAWRPVRGCMGDPGHIIVDPEARWSCRQGCRGCLESVASSLALEREAMASTASDGSGLLAAARDRDGRVSAADVIQAARKGDAAAVSLIEKLGAWLGMAAASWCSLYDPDLILFAGGVSSAGPLLLSAIDRTMRAVGLPTYVAETETGLAALGNDAGLVGAASLFVTPAGELFV